MINQGDSVDNQNGGRGCDSQMKKRDRDMEGPGFGGSCLVSRGPQAESSVPDLPSLCSRAPPADRLPRSPLKLRQLLSRGQQCCIWSSGLSCLGEEKRLGQADLRHWRI